jgi:hypothetical protein
MNSKSQVRNVAARARGVSGWMRSIGNKVRIIGADIADVRSRAHETTRDPTSAERRDELAAFYHRYEELVDILCSAAQYGPEMRLETRYQDVKGWMQSHYPAMRRSVVAYLRYDPADASQALELHGQPGDAFEALFAAPTVGEFVRCDDGHMIDRIERTRDALQRYGDHLRQMAD